MGIYNPWSLASRDPNCILNVSPYAGGTWHSVLFPDEPINFYTRNRTWSEFQTWCTSNLSLTDDFELEIQFYWGFTDVTQNYNIFGYGAASSPISVVYNRWSSSIKRIDVYTTLLETSAGQGWMSITPGALTQGEHTLITRKVGNVFSVILDGVTTSNSNGTPTGAYINTSAVTTTMDGSISMLKFTNLTTSEYWEPKRYHLYDLGVMPSDIPRNFAEEPATWYDLGAAAVVDLDDWEVGGEFYTSGVGAGKAILYRSTDPRFGLFAQTANQIRFFNYSGAGGSERIFDYIDYPRNTWVKWSMQRSGGWLRWVINHVEVKAIDKTGAYVAMDNGAALNSNADCLQRNLYFKNLTTGKTIWSYPTWEEQTRLFTFNNCYTNRSSFEIVDAASTNTMYIKTPLVLSGTPLEKTFIFEIETPAVTDSVVVDTLSRSGPTSLFIFSARIASVAESGYVQDVQASLFVKKTDGTNITIGGASTPVLTVPYFGKRTVAAVVVSRSGGYLTIYMGGTVVFNYTIPAEIGTTFAEIDDVFTLGSAYTTTPYKYSKISNVIVFDRALSTEEIARYS